VQRAARHQDPEKKRKNWHCKIDLFARHGMAKRTDGVMGSRHWQYGDSGDSDILCSKRHPSGKDSVIKGQPLLLFV
jgi:hypothetical protein